jgi:hypothetical protein
VRRILGYCLVVFVLSSIAAAACLAYGFYERRMAEAGESFATFDFDGAATTYERVDRYLGYADVLPWVGGQLRSDAQRRAAEARYWQGAYSALVTMAERRTADDPSFRFVVANALFRRAAAEHDRRAALEAIEGAVSGYKQTLEEAPDHLAAAFNYEYSLRVRRRLTNPPQPAESSIHGLEGNEPNGAGMEKVNILIPLQVDEQPKKGGTEAGKSAPRRKRG